MRMVDSNLQLTHRALQHDAMPYLLGLLADALLL